MSRLPRSGDSDRLAAVVAERDRLREALERIAEHAREWCREDLGAEHNYDRCNAPAEFILWGKLIAPEGLGPRCYDHAAKHVGHDALRRDSGWAIFDLRPLAGLVHIDKPCITREELANLRSRCLELEDRLSDVLLGVRLWQESKGIEDWSDRDECLLRWVEHNERTG